MTREEIFDRIAKFTMKEWDLDKFKKDFPTFNMVIQEAMSEYANIEVKGYNNYKILFEAAKKFIDEHPADPDITDKQTEAWLEYTMLLKKFKL